MYDHKENTKSKRDEKQLNSISRIQQEKKNLEFQFELQLKEKAARSNKTGLPDHLKTGIESFSGYSMDDVKVHYNSSKPSQLNAHAYAQGNQIHLASGQEKHLPHEAWHVVQQKQGRVQATAKVNGAAINDDQSLEKEADVMGTKIAGYKEKPVQAYATTRIVPKILQAVWIEEYTEPNATKTWDILMDGVKWYADDDGNMWYKVVSSGEEDYSTLSGYGERQTFSEWHKLRSESHPEEYYLPFVEYEKESTGIEDNIAIMEDIIGKAHSHVDRLSSHTSDPSFLASMCINVMEVLNNEARQRMEGSGAKLKSGRIQLVASEVAKLITRLNGTDDAGARRGFLGDFYGWNIANQNFQESNNRGTYIMLVLMGGIYGIAIPSPGRALSREKKSFFARVIKQQFLEMYEEVDEV